MSLYSTLAMMAVVSSTMATSTFSIQQTTSTGKTVAMRHCAFVMYGTSHDHPGPAGDYVWTIVPALNGNKSAVSFRSSDYPSKFAAIVSGSSLEGGRLGVISPPAELNDASFEQVPGLSDVTQASFRSLSTGPYKGMYITLSSALHGTCAVHYNSKNGEGDVVLSSGGVGASSNNAAAAAAAAATWTLVPATAPPAPPTPTPPPPPGPVAVTVDLDDVTHQISPLSMGCHSDSGYEHQARGFYSQMIVSSSFNSTGFPGGKWNVGADAGVVFSATQDETDSFYDVASEKIVYTSGKGSGWLSNRGLGNAGMVFESGKQYEGYIFAKAIGGTAPVTVTVSLDNYLTGTSLASSQLTIAPATTTTATTTGGGGSSSSSDGSAGVGEDDNGFVRYNFTFTPSASTTCVDIAPASDPSVDCGHGVPRSSVGHTCTKCGGEFKLALNTPASVAVNYVFLQPGEWGRVPGLPVLASAASVLKQMGIKAIRQGGSYASGHNQEGSADYYQWQKWSGPAWTRPSRNSGVWKSCLLAGWGPFEMIDMCNALDIEPIITTTDTSTAESFADLVEYTWGNSSTKMGAKRAADGHPLPYKVKYFELGNEQYNSNYVEQVAAMEAKAVELGMGKTIHYMFPQNQFLNQADIAKASLLNPRMDDQMVADIHIGGGGAVEAARKLFASTPSFKMGAVNAETNAGTHVFSRAMSEASDLNDWFNAGDITTRLHFRAASFCMGDSTDFDSWDQGISFFLQNQTWLQPPGYVHQMIDQTWQSNALNISSTPPSPATQSSAQRSDDGKTVVLRWVNSGSEPQNVTVTLHGSGQHTGTAGTRPAAAAATAAVPSKVQMWSISSDDPGAANSPGNPTAVSPVSTMLPGFASGSTVTVKGNSYTIIQMDF